MKHSIGIFSRSDKSEYAWLVTLFLSSDFADWVKDVRSTLITNNGFRQFLDDLSQCSLGIIYHTKNRGGINITNVPGSLYDEELENLNELLGRNNVIVVIDDVEDDSQEEKIRILELQPSIEKLACDLLLILKTEKNNTKSLMTKLKNLAPFHSISGMVESLEHYCGNSNTESFSTRYNHQTQKIPSGIEDLMTQHSLEENNIYETPYVLDTSDKESEIYVGMSKIRDISENSEKLPNNECPETHFFPKTRYDNQILKKPHNKGFPMNQTDKEISKKFCSSESSMKLHNEELSEIQFFVDKDLLCRGENPDILTGDSRPKPLCAQKTLQSQLSDENWSEVLGELKLKQKLKKQF